MVLTSPCLSLSVMSVMVPVYMILTEALHFGGLTGLARSLSNES